MQLGRGHTKGDTVVWLPQDHILFSGDLVEYDATPYTGDAYLADWPATLDAIAALKPQKLVPGRGAALTTPDGGQGGPRRHARVRHARCSTQVKRGRRAGQGPAHRLPGHVRGAQAEFGHWVIFDHCLPFDVTRAYDEATRYPRSAHLDGPARQGDVASARRLIGRDARDRAPCASSAIQ